jgi:hypothetical protein
VSCDYYYGTCDEEEEEEEVITLLCCAAALCCALKTSEWLSKVVRNVSEKSCKELKLFLVPREVPINSYTYLPVVEPLSTLSIQIMLSLTVVCLWNRATVC